MTTEREHDDEHSEFWLIGFEAGLMEAVALLRRHAIDYDRQATESKRVSDGAGAVFSATILRSFANGLEMQADIVRAPSSANAKRAATDPEASSGS